MTPVAPYVPGPDERWAHLEPEQAGFDPTRLEEAIAFHHDHETSLPRELGPHLRARYAETPHGEIVGPTRDRGGVNGMVLRGGYVVAEWGDTERVDMSFSVTKSLLSAVAGVAYDRGLLGDVHERVAARTGHEAFTSPQNRDITWHHLLSQTSEWEGTLWGKPDSADRRRGHDRTLNAPGTFWEYNDVRVNLLALQLLRVFGTDLPSVAKRELLDPIGASDAWRWHGYETSVVTLGDRTLTSVSGGGHWGGGLWIGTRDLARYGLLYQRGGRWNGRDVLSRDWIERTRTPSPIEPSYGYLWWLNTGRQLFPAAPPSTYAAIGGNTNMLWVVPDHDLVIVVRWIDAGRRAELLAKLLGALAER